ncbi:claudin domain-containing protein 2 [Ornithorhynchus anatinus]|nr:claudin domain-containing protein 2 [Ornithorhynchus anatinus]XP_028922141.1 claudin domain-containing protein 2 [Ornithorhynchus anatinus]
MGVKRSLQIAGLTLSIFADLLLLLAAATDFWVRSPEGHRGLWRECHQDSCSAATCETMVAISAACLMLSLGAEVTGTTLGIWVLQGPKNTMGVHRGRTAWALCFLSTFLLIMAMVVFTLREVMRGDVFFSWSYFCSWLALPFTILSGLCFLFADMIIQGNDAIREFPVCL